MFPRTAIQISDGLTEQLLANYVAISAAIHGHSSQIRRRAATVCDLSSSSHVRLCNNIYSGSSVNLIVYLNRIIFNVITDEP